MGAPRTWSTWCMFALCTPVHASCSPYPIWPWREHRPGNPSPIGRPTASTAPLPTQCALPFGFCQQDTTLAFASTGGPTATTGTVRNVDAASDAWRGAPRRTHRPDRQCHFLLPHSMWTRDLLVAELAAASCLRRGGVAWPTLIRRADLCCCRMGSSGVFWEPSGHRCLPQTTVREPSVDAQTLPGDCSAISP